MSEQLELGDIQGLLVRGYSRLPFASYLLLHIDGAPAARRAISSWMGRLTSAAQSPTTTAANIALTAAGLSILRDNVQLPTTFSFQFASGMASPIRSRMLGDIADDDPARWSWGGPNTDDVHVLYLIYACDQDRLSAAVREFAEGAAGGGFRIIAELSTDRLTGREHFGFRDGISQPLIAGLPRAGEGGDVVQAGEFILGYQNEYGQRTERPLVDPVNDPDRLLPLDADGSGAHDLGRNGSYLVFRQLEQNVDAFRGYLEKTTKDEAGRPDEARQRLLAAKIVGRWQSGTSLALSPDRDDPELSEVNTFGYHHEDPNGLGCPVGSHVRRANPRDALPPSPGTDRSLAINHRHRLLRRGRKYTMPASGGSTPGVSKVGVHFIALNANLARQFEFVQHSWINDPCFNGLVDSTDPLVGTRSGRGATFSVQDQPLRHRYQELPQFVHVRGGAYFFLPGLQALRYLVSPPTEH